MLHRVQNDLFNVGTDLATPAKDRWPGMFRVGGDEVQRLEGWIDELNEDLGPLKEFILPGGGPVGAYFPSGAHGLPSRRAGGDHADGGR
jgi:cob(I)alamin adenosyltransferase